MNRFLKYIGFRTESVIGVQKIKVSRHFTCPKWHHHSIVLQPTHMLYPQQKPSVGMAQCLNTDDKIFVPTAWVPTTIDLLRETEQPCEEPLIMQEVLLSVSLEVLVLHTSFQLLTAANQQQSYSESHSSDCILSSHSAQSEIGLLVII